MLMITVNTLLDAAANVAGTAASEEVAAGNSLLQSLPSLVMMVLMVVVFYFLLIRPQRKKDKAVKDMLSAIKVGDRVCTIGGIYGTVTAVKDDTLTIAIGSQKTPLVIARWAIKNIDDAPLENNSEPLV